MSETNSDIRDVMDRFNNRDKRGEERWHETIHTQVMQWAEECGLVAEKHDNAGYGAMFKHVVFGLPGPIATISLGVVAGLWDDPDSKFLILPVSGMAAISTAVHVFMNMGGRAQKHWDFAARYKSIKIDVNRELSRDIDFRRPADEFMMEISSNMNSLNASAPPLPGSGCCNRKPPVVETLPSQPDANNEAIMEYHRERRHRAYVNSNKEVGELV